MRLNENTKKAQQMIENYIRCRKKAINGDCRYMSVTECYERPSRDKIYIENRIITQMQLNGGENYTITEWNSCTFSCAYIYPDKITCEIMLRYETRYNSYDIPFNVCIL